MNVGLHLEASDDLVLAAAYFYDESDGFSASAKRFANFSIKSSASARF